MTAETTNPKLQLLAEEVARIVNSKALDIDAGLGELGIDSLNVVELMLACEQIYQSDVSPEELTIDQYTSLRELDRQLTACSAHVAA